MRLALVAGLVSTVAVLPIAVHAYTKTVNVSLYGLEYAATSTCGSFAGVATSSGQTGTFNTTVCHEPLIAGRAATISPGGSFVLSLPSVKLVGQYEAGSVGQGAITQFGFFCTEKYAVNAMLGPSAASPGTINIAGGSATGTLTHIGILSGGACNAFAATLSGYATLNY